MRWWNLFNDGTHHEHQDENPRDDNYYDFNDFLHIFDLDFPHEPNPMSSNLNEFVPVIITRRKTQNAAGRADF